MVLFGTEMGFIFSSRRYLRSLNLYSFKVLTPFCSVPLILYRSHCDSHISSSHFTIHQTEDINNVIYSRIPNGTMLGGLSFGRDFVFDIYRIFLRTTYLAWVFAPAFASLPFYFFFSTNDQKSRWWNVFRDCIRKSGPCISKLCQWIGTRPDIFPAALCDELKELQKMGVIHLTPHTNLHLERLFSKEELKNVDIIEMVGSGCVAQVYHAIINKEDVAIKVVHPDIQNTIMMDLLILKHLIHLVDLLPGMSVFALQENLSEFRALMLQQIDLRREAQNLKKFTANFEQSSFRDLVRFPRPLEPFVSESVLVESFERGRLMIDAIEELSLADRRRLARLGLHLFLKMVFEDNFIHADLHPGNIIVQHHRPPPSPDNPPAGLSARLAALLDRLRQDAPAPRLVLIDTGLVTSLGERDRVNFVDLFHAVVMNDGVRVANLLIDRQTRPSRLQLTPPDSPERHSFQQVIAEVVGDVHEHGLNLGRLGVDNILRKVLVACYVSQVRLDPKYIAILVSIGVLEGLGRRLDPDINILREAVPYVIRASMKIHMNMR